MSLARSAAPASPAARIALPAQEEDIATMRRLLVAKLTYAVGKDPMVASDRDWFVATALAVRDRIVDRWMPTTRASYAHGHKRVYYLSLEFLIGRLLMDSLSNLGLTETVRSALAELDVDLERLREIEPDPALGNGGLGRLAACFMESMATLQIAAFGYGIRYNHGLFRQEVKDGWQQEYPENWLSFGNPWEFERPEVLYKIGFGGSIEDAPGPNGTSVKLWRPAEIVDAVASSTRSGSGRRAPTIRCNSRPSTRATMSARSPSAPAPTPSARCSTPATTPRPARNSGCARNISSPPPRCTT